MDHLIFPFTIKNKLVAYKRFLASIGEKAKKVVLIMIIRSNFEEEERGRLKESKKKLKKV